MDFKIYKISGRLLCASNRQVLEPSKYWNKMGLVIGAFLVAVKRWRTNRNITKS